MVILRLVDGHIYSLADFIVASIVDHFVNFVLILVII